MMKNVVFNVLIIWFVTLSCANVRIYEQEFFKLEKASLNLLAESKKNKITRSDIVEFRRKVQNFINLCKKSGNFFDRYERVLFIDQARQMESDVLAHCKITGPSSKSLFAVLQQRADQLQYLKSKGTVSWLDVVDLANDIERFKNEHFALFYDLRWIRIFNDLVDRLEHIRQYHALSEPIKDNILFKFQIHDDVAKSRDQKLLAQRPSSISQNFEKTNVSKISDYRCNIF